MASTWSPGDADWITGMAMPYSARPVLGSVVAEVNGSRCTRAEWAGCAAVPLVRNAPGNGRQAVRSRSKLASATRFRGELVAGGRWVIPVPRPDVGDGEPVTVTMTKPARSMTMPARAATPSVSGIAQMRARRATADRATGWSGEESTGASLLTTAHRCRRRQC
jgi:hypothetical protein